MYARAVAPEREGRRVAKRHVLGHYPEMTHEQARDAARIAKRAIHGHADAGAAIAAREPRTLGEVINVFLASPMALRKEKVTAVYQRGMRQALQVPVRKGSADHFATIRGKPSAGRFSFLTYGARAVRARDNVIAGADCGFGGLRSLMEGAEAASRALF
jgi:hypothetical protein